MNKKITVLSLFDGMAGARIALDRLGIECDYYASEVDKWAKKIAQKNYPDIIQLGDIQKLSYEDGVLSSEMGEFLVGEIDLVIGGSPCQGFSFSRLDERPNFDDPRSALFFEFARILKETGPHSFLLENVPMDVQSERVISELLDTKPLRINSSLFSAQHRERLYWTNIAPDFLPEDRGICFSDIIHNSHSQPLFPLDENSAECLGGISGEDFPMLCGYSRRSGIGPSRRKAKTVLASDYKAGATLNRNQMQNAVIHKKNGVLLYRRLSPVEYERLQTVPDNYTAGVSDTQRYKMLGNGFTIDVIAHILSFANFYP